MQTPRLGHRLPLSRRSFLKYSAAGAAMAALGGPLLRAAGRVTTLPKPQQSGIEHIVVVCMENRSFDHFFGWVPGSNGKQSAIYTDSTGASFTTHALAPEYQGCLHPDPDHSYEGGRVEFNGGLCDGWLRAGQNDIYAIGYYTRDDLAFFGNAVNRWTVCDQFFASILAGTYPNRFYLHAAQTDRLDDSLSLSTLPTIWDSLAAKSLPAKYYFSDIPFLALWGLKYVPFMHDLEEFYADCVAGTLPAVSYVDPHFLGEQQGLSNDDHPHADIRNGELFLSVVYQAVTQSPNWPNTVLVITYDEWGGFFDHVPPALAPIPPATAAAGDTDGRRGFRVPALIVSPWSPAAINHVTFDHTSILKMIEWRWHIDPLTIRDATANNLAAALDFSRPNLAAPVLAVTPGTYGSSCGLTETPTDSFDELALLAEGLGIIP